MLLMASAPDPGQPGSSPGVGGADDYAACDVWALGCLLYELITSTVLFPTDLDWPKFFIKVTEQNQVCRSPTDWLVIVAVDFSWQCGSPRLGNMHARCLLPYLI